MKGVISMSGRKIYSAELKLEIVERYLKGDIGIKKLAQEYHVGYGDIQKWRDAYQEHGAAGLSTTHGTYTGEFKVSVVEYMHNTGASIRKTAAHFNIPSGLFPNGNASTMSKERMPCLKNREAGHQKWEQNAHENQKQT